MNKKLGKILLLSITTLCLSVGAVLGLTKTNVTVQAEDAYTVTNIEDFIDNQQGKIFYKNGDTVIGAVDGDNYNNITSKKTAYNAYAGNVQVDFTCVQYGTDWQVYPGNGLTFVGTTAETVMSFRTLYGLGEADHGIAFMCRADRGVAEAYPQQSRGYSFWLKDNKLVVSAHYTTPAFSPVEASGVVLSEYTVDTDKVANGDNVIVTYGSFTNSETGAVVLIFKLDKVNADGSTSNVLNCTCRDESENKMTTTSNFTILFKGSRLILGGIEKPIFTGNGYTYPESVTAGTKLSTVSIPGYTWTDANATVKAGTHAYSATYNYFGKAVQENVMLTAEYSYDVTKIEDFVNGDSTKVGFHKNGQYRYFNGSLNEGNYIYNASHPNMTTAQTTDNVYAGNMQVAFTQEGTTDAYAHNGNGVVFSADSGVTTETVMSFRMKYGLGGGMAFMCRASVIDDYLQNLGGYSFRLASNTVYVNRHTVGGNGGYSPIQVNGTNLTSATLSGVTDGDDVIVTYGSFTESETGNVVLIFKMDKVNADYTTTNVVDCVCVDSSADKITQYNNMTIAFDSACLVLGGVDTPIFYDNADKSYTVADVTKLTAGVTSPLSTVTLSEGYAWVNGNEALKEGTFAYDAIYTYGDLYYGAYPTQACKVTVSAREPSYAVALLDETGTVTTTTTYVHIGDSYTLVDDGTVGLLGWYIGENLYPVGHTFTPTADCSIKRVSLNMVVSEGAAIRYATNNGNYGLTFEVKVNKAQYDALTTAGVIADFNGYICPVDLLGAGFNQNAVVDIKAATMTEVDGYYVIRYTLTNILNSNINRKFAGQAYVVVNYANDTTANVFADYEESKHARSVLERAKDALEKHNNAVATDTMDGRLNAYALSVVTSYVNSVAEIAVNAQGVGTVVETEAGDSIERKYTLVSYEETANGNEVNVTLKLDYSDVALYEPAENDKINLPVTLYVLSGGEYVELRIVTPTVVWDGKSVTLTFSYVKED